MNNILLKVDTYMYSILNASLYSNHVCNEEAQCALADDGYSCTAKESSKTYDLHNGLFSHEYHRPQNYYSV